MKTNRLVLQTSNEKAPVSVPLDGNGNTNIPKIGIGRIHVTMGMVKRTLQKVAQFLT